MMEIMREFKEKVKSFADNEPEQMTKFAAHKICDELTDPAVKREICKVLNRIDSKAQFKQGWSSKEVRDMIKFHIDKYSPAPQYCEGMQEAIDKGRIYISEGKQYFICNYEKPSFMKPIKRCPFCEDGNCIGDTHDNA